MTLLPYITKAIRKIDKYMQRTTVFAWISINSEKDQQIVADLCTRMFVRNNFFETCNSDILLSLYWSCSNETSKEKPMERGKMKTLEKSTLDWIYLIDYETRSFDFKKCIVHKFA